ncbi:MAG: prolipoprotein diacylglyceryl transferase [Polyangiaceae bacterium]
MTPLIPYVEVAPLVLWKANGPGADPISLKPFGLLVSAGVYLGAWVSSRYARQRGVAPAAMASFIYWVVVLGFVGGHVLDVVFYSPERLLSDPLSLLRLWDGLSSFGGFIGGALGALVWRLRQRTAILPYADIVASGLPLGWLFGRAGCAVVHDHPGIASDAWFAVAYPGGGRLDLGLLEMALTLPIAVGFLLLQRRAFPWGFFLGVLSCVYAPLRFGLDFLRIRTDVPALDLYADRRFAELTPAQWACLALFAFGAWLLRRSLRSAHDDAAFRAPPLPAAFARAPALDADR